MPDVFWIDSYGKIRWEDEKARLDNFAIQLQNDPTNIGYIYIYAGARSCHGEAVSHALKVRRYLVDFRNVSWDQVAFRDLGYEQDFHVKLWMFPRGQPPRYNPDYKPPTRYHIIKDCKLRRAHGSDQDERWLNSYSSKTSVEPPERAFG